MLYPLTFHPLFKERVWGGRKLAEIYHKSLPPGVPIGESWEISDRPGDVSVIANGPLAGQDLHWLVERHAPELLGATQRAHGRFPLLIKILDAQETLSLQVHPPPAKAAELGGESKTEMWYIADAAPGAEIFVGLRRGVTRADFERKIQAGTVADCLHRLSVRPGDAMFLPSGRVHAIGAGLVIFEIQQNSDTTYRVFDWNRVGLDGKPRALHLDQSLASIDFNDFEPALIRGEPAETGPATAQTLVSNPLFKVEVCRLQTGQSMLISSSNPRIIGLLEGRIVATDGANSVELGKGQFCLVPAGLRTELGIEQGSTLLLIETGG